MTKKLTKNIKTFEERRWTIDLFSGLGTISGGDYLAKEEVE